MTALLCWFIHIQLLQEFMELWDELLLEIHVHLLIAEKRLELIREVIGQIRLPVVSEQETDCKKVRSCECVCVCVWRGILQCHYISH